MKVPLKKQIELLEKELQKTKVQNLESLQKMKGQVEKEQERDLKEQERQEKLEENVKQYIEYIILNLEMKQLSESITRIESTRLSLKKNTVPKVFINHIKKFNDRIQSPKEKLKIKEYQKLDFKLKFDSSTKIPSMWIDYNTLNILR